MKKFFFLSFLFIIVINLSAQNNKFRTGIFLHHSTGSRIWGPNGSTTSVPQQLTLYNNSHGYSGSDNCTMVEQAFPTDEWNNEWYRWHEIFDNKRSGANIQPIIQNNKIVMIKSCYPSSGMNGWGSASDTNNPGTKSVLNYKWHWRNIIQKMKEHPECFFIIWTNAPLVSSSDPMALMSHYFSKWAKDTLANGLDQEIGAFPKNVYVFDFFHKLTDESSNWKLKSIYASSSNDSHPNGAATDLVAPQLVQELFDAAIAYEGVNSVQEKIDYNDLVNVYPNPSDGVINIKINDEKDELINWEIYDALGRTLLTSNSPSNRKLNSLIKLDLNEKLSNESSFFIIKIQIGNEIVTRKVAIIQ